MPQGTRVIKGRIRAVANTKKITKAMELVAASKMRRAVTAVVGSRPYATLSAETIKSLSGIVDVSAHPLLARRDPVKKILLIFIAADRGLCGGFNTQIGKTAARFYDEARVSSIPCDIVSVGKRAALISRKFGWNIVATFSGLSNHPAATDVRAIATIAINEFLSGTYDRVALAFTKFDSSLRQTPYLKELLPLHPMTKDPGANSVSEKLEYLFEPSPGAVLDRMLPRILEAQIYQAILESGASEHAARMMAMRNATESAQEFIEDLVFTFNQARQASITREIAEISAGKVTLEE